MAVRGNITSVFKSLKDTNEKAFIPYIMAGDPSLEKTVELVLTLEDCGAHMVELGVPFTDPVADGPQIQRAAERALQKGVTLRKVLSTVAGIRVRTDIPIILMTYYNPIFKYGGEDFVKDAIEAGVSGIIVPDLLPDEEEDFIEFATSKGLDTIFLLAPTSTMDRVKLVCKKSRGFIYYVSITGITGANISLGSELSTMIKTIQDMAQIPVGVGFGIKTPDEAKAVAEIADGVIVGSSIVKMIDETKNSDNITALRDYVSALSKAIKDG